MQTLDSLSPNPFEVGFHGHPVGGLACKPPFSEALEILKLNIS